MPWPLAEGGRVVSPRYCLLPADLRDVEALAAALEGAGFDPSLPTFVLSECVLVYMEPQHSAAVVRWLGATLRCAAMAIYEQVRAVPAVLCCAALCVQHCIALAICQQVQRCGPPLTGVAPWCFTMLHVARCMHVSDARHLASRVPLVPQPALIIACSRLATAHAVSAAALTHAAHAAAWRLCSALRTLPPADPAG